LGWAQQLRVEVKECGLLLHCTLACSFCRCPCRGPPLVAAAVAVHNVARVASKGFGGVGVLAWCCDGNLQCSLGPVHTSCMLGAAYCW
jgi:hypothetical protein